MKGFNDMKIFKILLLLSGLGIILSGCSINRAYLFEYDKDGNEIQFKRRAKYNSVNYVSKWSKKAYKKNNRTLHFMLSDEQEEVIKEHGQPDYIRKRFLSTHGDFVKEWIYHNSNLMFQFVGGKLVYEGPTTDVEKVLMLYGYPRYSITTKLDPDVVRETFIYHSSLTDEFEDFNFSNGKLLSGQVLK